MRSYDKLGVVEEITAAGGAVFGITSEPQALAGEATQAWNMSIPVIGDPHHEIRKDLKARGILELFYNPDAGHLRERDWASHPNGYYQPGTVAIHKSGRVLYRWRCVPKYSNMSGAGGRPEARYTWRHMQEALAAETSQDAAPDREPLLGAPELSWFRFLLILVAHGWFIRPRAFPLLRDGDKAAVTPKDAMRRVWVFLGLWLVAALMLPAGWVLAAAALWLLALTPGLIEIHRQFQNEADEF